ncbi:tRNA amidotransferase [Yersinia phage phiR2-01]|uniref:Uncharacterized protein n=1 Tax=Yersinia phage phiR2-01 TaxID=1206557 RepID=I7J3T8_9CAUD|nr:tRNA amidotransferase [Yersinia phage phiR2-01]CCI88498.1 hypothetical protein BN79_089 [Yersinia phage phiR2-01]
MGENILNILRDLLQAARINGDKDRARNLQTMIGDLQRIDKNYVSRDQLVAYINSQLKAAEAAKQKAMKVGVEILVDEDYDRLLITLLQEYQPTQLNESQVRSYFAELVKLNPGITKGLLMKTIKQEYPGQYDGSMAAQIAGEFN